MGKKKITIIDDSQEKSSSKDKNKAKSASNRKPIFRWEEAYADLKPGTANILRQARLKPDQIASMADGELLSLEGIGPAALEEIRANYPATIVDTKPKNQPKETKKKERKIITKSPEKPKPLLPKTRRPRATIGRSAAYKDQKSKLKLDIYPLPAAVKVLREVSYSVHKTVELHLNVKETGIRGEASLPHSIGKKIKVTIFTPELADQIKAGKIDFNILLARPDDMNSIATLARVLGPKGLMPNPKNNTITDNPEKRKEELEKGAILTYRTEAKNPIIHLRLGSLDQKDEELVENIQAALTAIGPHKIISAYLKSTMSPAIHLDISPLK